MLLQTTQLELTDTSNTGLERTVTALSTPQSSKKLKKKIKKLPKGRKSIFLQNLIQDISAKTLLEKDPTTQKTLLERSIVATSRTKPEAILNFASKLLPKDNTQQEQPKFAPIILNLNTQQIPENPKITTIDISPNLPNPNTPT